MIDAGIKAHKEKVASGIEALMDETGIAHGDFIAGKGTVDIVGEIWNAESADPIVKNEPVVVTGFKGMLLNVKRK